MLLKFIQTKAKSLRAEWHQLSLSIAAVALCLPQVIDAKQRHPVALDLTFVTSNLNHSHTRSFTQNPQQPAKKKPLFFLRVTEEAITGISLRAEDVKLSEIAPELSRKLKVPVTLSRVMEKQRASVDFSDLLLEPAMQLLAPIVYIDYEIESTPGAQPRPLGIYLYAHNEPPPAVTAAARGKAQAIVISGNTEEVEDSEEEEVRVSYKAGRITVKARDQPLVDVLSRIAEELGIPLEAGDDSTETVSVNIQDLPVDEAILRVSPHLRLYVRADLFRREKTPLRIVLVERDKKVVE